MSLFCPLRKVSIRAFNSGRPTLMRFRLRFAEHHLAFDETVQELRLYGHLVITVRLDAGAGEALQKFAQGDGVAVNGGDNLDIG